MPSRATVDESKYPNFYEDYAKWYHIKENAGKFSGKNFKDTAKEMESRVEYRDSKIKDTERIMEKKKADSVETRKQVRQGVRHVLKNGMR